MQNRNESSPYSSLIFDLDGTISDPKEGIFKSVSYALGSFGYPVPEIKAIDHFIGPPIDIAFKHLAATIDEKIIAALVAKYRERYTLIGFEENRLYEDVKETIKKLYAAGIKLGVCTSKRTDLADKVLSYFDIRHYFSFVDGGDIGISKVTQLKSLLSRGLITENSKMIGDRDVDVCAAKKNNLGSIAVAWGYGGLDELEACKPDIFCRTPQELLTLVLK